MTDLDYAETTDTTFRNFGGARAVSAVMKTMAVLVLLGGLFSAAVIATDHATIGTSSPRVVSALVAFLGSVLIAALWAWFGYVLDVLLESYYRS